MNEINQLKTYNNNNIHYTPNSNSFFSNENRILLYKNIKDKILTQKKNLLSFNSTIKSKNDNNNMPNLFQNNTNRIRTPNRNYKMSNNIASSISNNSYRLNIPLPSMINNYSTINKEHHYKACLNYNCINKKINIFKEKSPNKDNYNNSNNKENIESVEWMIYNRKNNKKINNNDINVLDEIYTLKKNEELLKMNLNIMNLQPSKIIKNINSYNEFKKRHSKDYLLIKNNKSKKKSFEVKDNNYLEKEKDNNNLLLDNNKNIKQRKLIKYCFLSVPGSHNGAEIKNQDCTLILPKINGCNNVKIFGIFNGHGINGDKISNEVCEYFNYYYNNTKLYEKKIDNTESIEKCSISDTIKTFNKLNIQLKSKSKGKEKEKENRHLKLKQLIQESNKKKSLILSKFAKIKSTLNNNNLKNEKIKNIYNIISSDNYYQIYNSYKSIDTILHEKYTINKICEGSGTTASYIIIFNDYYSNTKNNNNSENNNNYRQNTIYNKIISTNLGNIKNILITEDKKIKELNVCHTPCIKEERIRIEKNGGKIDRIDWLKVGPLRVWFQDKKSPGLSITRSFGDFEAESLGILSIPDVNEFDIDEEKTKIIVMGTNGIWEFLTNEKIMDIIWNYYEWDDVDGAAQKIIEIAGKLWKIKNPKNIPDLTVIILFFK